MAHARSKFTGVASKLSAVTALLACLCVPGLLYAQQAVDIDISIVKGDSVQITNIDDWTIGVFGPNDNINNIQYQWDETCVFSSTGAYQFEVISQNGGANLRLISGANEMNYTLYTYSRVGGGYQLLGNTESNYVIAGRSGAANLDCSDEPWGGGGVNLWFAALIAPADFNPAPAGVYQDLVTIIVSPE